MSLSIKIQGQSSRTSAVRAARFVRDGRAKWADAAKTTILFDAGAHQHQSAIRTAGLDGKRGPMSMRELRRLPFVGDVSKLMRA